MSHVRFSVWAQIVFVAVLALSASWGRMPVIEQTIAQHVNEVVSEVFVSEDQVRKSVESQLKTLRFLTSDNKWARPEFERLEESLLSEVSLEKIQSLVVSMAHVAEENDYLHAAIERVSLSSIDGSLVEELSKSFDPLVPDLATYAYVAEEINKAATSDPKFLKTMYDHLQQYEHNVSKVSALQAVKHYSVKAAIKKSLDSFEAGRVDPGFSSFLLPMNIAEATFLDWWYDHKGNASAGWELMKHGPSKYSELETGALPAQFKKDGSAVLVTPPYPENWAKLYASWNAGFVSNLQAYPYHLVKLMIPSVNNFYQEPGQYMYNRTCALYLHMYYLMFRSVDDKSFLKMNLESDVVAMAFSEANRVNAKTYAAQFKKGA